MVRQLRPRSIAGALVAGAVTTVLLTACGQTAPQSKEHSSTDGISATVKAIAVRNAHITLSPDGPALLSVALFNEGSQSDELTAVTPGKQGAFTTAVLPSTEQIAAAFRNAGLAPVFNSPFAEASGSSSASSPSSDSTSSASSQAGASSVTLPTTTGVFLNRPPAEIILQGLPSETRAGQFVPVTLTFASAGSVTLQMPVVGSSSSSDSAESSDGASSSPTDASTVENSNSAG